jgi:hypothetical protein
MTIMLAALPGIVRAPTIFRRSAPISARELGFVLVGIAAMVIFGAALAMIGSRLIARETSAPKSRT